MFLKRFVVMDKKQEIITDLAHREWLQLAAWIKTGKLLFKRKKYES